MVNMRMRDPYLLKGDTKLFATIEQHVQVTTWIDDGAAHGFVAPHHGAVLLERGDGDSFVLEHLKAVARTKQ
jgi:hypothetical protein